MSLEIDIKMCRICMKSNNNGISIYSDRGIIKKLQFCTQLEISKTDDLPKIICNKCVGLLEIAYDFCKQAECSDKYLRQVITHHKKELNQSELGKQGLYDEMVLEIYRTKIKVEQDDQIEQLTDFESEEISIINISPTLEEDINCKGTKRLTDSVPVYAVAGECSAADKVKIEEADIEKIQETKQINLFTIAKVTSIPKTEFSQTNEMTGNVRCSQEDIESLSEDKQNKVDQSDQMKQLTNVKSVKISETIEDGIQYKGSICGADIVRIEKLQETIFTIEKVTSIRKNEDDQTGAVTGKEIVPLQGTKRLTDSVPIYAVVGECSAGPADQVKIKEEEVDIEKIQETKQINLFTIAKVTSILKTEFNQTKEMTGNVSCSQEDIESLSADKHINIERGDQLKQPTDVKSATITDTIKEDIQYKESTCGADIAKIEKLPDTTFIKAKVTSIRKNEDAQTGKFKCIECGAHFTQKGSLKRHSQIHLKGANQTDKWVCMVCGERFTTNGSLKRHSLTHSGVRPYKCNLCSRSFALSFNLESHKRRHSARKPYTCEICGLPFWHQSSLKRHDFKKHQNQKKTEMEINVEKQRERKRQATRNGIALVESVEEGVHYKGTERQIYTLESEEEEIEEEKVQETKPINVNNITTTEVTSIRKNDDDQTDKIECKVCGVHFTKRASLKRHSIIHSGERPFKCNLCSRSFAQRYNLAAHKRRHRGEKGYTCETCGSLFRSKKSLKQHVFIKHGNQKKAEMEKNVIKQKERKRQPTQNGTALAETIEEGVHYKGTERQAYTWESEEEKMQETKRINDITTTEVTSIRKNDDDQTDKIECKVCGVHFTKRASLKRHSLIHSGERPHKCNSCDGSFAQRYNLIRHMMLHSPENPYVCETCGFPFRHQSSLNRHVSTKHENQKKAETEINVVKQSERIRQPIECTLCGVQFTKRASLKRHSLIHSGERPHKCNLCDLSFAQKYTLSCHMVRHSGEKPYTCETCGLPFRLQTSLDRHILIKHENQNKAEVRRILLKQKEICRRRLRLRRLLLARETPEEAALRKEKEAAGTRRQRYLAKQMQTSNE